MLDSGCGTEGGPLSPDKVLFLLGFLLLRIQDNSIVCSAQMRNEEILLGSGEISKPSGINCGMWEWKPWVGMLSGGSREPSGCGYPQSFPTKLKRSETVFWLPWMCWLARQWVLFVIRHASFRAIIWTSR
jgi:hypothetical protein